jgi:hypothetical protein
MPIGTGLATSAQTMQSLEPVPSDMNWHAIRPSSPADSRSNVRLASASTPNNTNSLANSSFSLPQREPSTFTTSQQDNDQALQLTTPELQDALIELSQIVARPPERWDLSSLRSQALRWVEQGESAIQRGEARLLLERIDRFDSLRQRTDASNGGVINTGSATSASYVPATATTLPSDPASLSNAKQADASGWLTQVHTSQPGQPEFALTDLSGNVIAYVNPAPGVNLRRYNREAVAIYGARGYLPELAAKQIYAERVVRLK